VLSYAPALLENANTKRAPEIARVIGESYVAKQNYEEALPYLEQYKEKVGSLNRTDFYQSKTNEVRNQSKREKRANNLTNEV
jgi:hypothetical protein